MGNRQWRLVAAHGVGLGLAWLFWWAFTEPFPLYEFCSRNRPTWIIPLFEQPRYTAMPGHELLLVTGVASAAFLGALFFAAGLRGRLASLSLLAVVPIGFVFVLAPAYPLLSSDIFKYVFDGRILTVYGENPFLHVPAEHPEDRFYDLVYWKAVVNAHGPLWRLAEAFAASVGGENCRTAIVAMKIWPILAYLATTAVLFVMLDSWQPKRAIWGTMVYAWCPVVVLEAVQNGHNDVVAALPALAAVWMAVRGKLAIAFPLLAIAVLIKPLALVLGPVLLATMIPRGARVATHESRLVSRDVLLGLAMAAAIVVIAYLPFWAGPATLQGLARGDLFSTSPAKALLELLETAGLPFEMALPIASRSSTATFVILGAVVVLAAFRGRLPLVPAVCGVIFLYLLVGAQWFNPWYMLWLVPFLAVVPAAPPLVMGLAFTLLSPIVYALRDSWSVVAVVFLPVFALAVWWRGWLGWPCRSRSAPRPDSKASEAS